MNQRTLDANASEYERARWAYNDDPRVPGRYEAVEDTWDAMVDAVEVAGHHVDTCACKSCGYYRAGTTEDGSEEEKHG